MIEKQLEELPEQIAEQEVELHKKTNTLRMNRDEMDMERAIQTLKVSVFHLSENEKKAKVHQHLKEHHLKILLVKSEVDYERIKLRKLERELDVTKELLHLEMAKMKLI